MQSEVGEICIYKDDAFVYDSFNDGTKIGDESIFFDIYDEIDISPVMIIPTSDIIGLLKDLKTWHEYKLSNYR